MRLINTHYIFPCRDAKSFLTADHLMGAVSGRAQVVFLSERLSEMCVSECIQEEPKTPARRCDFVSPILWEVQPSADRCEVLSRIK